MNLNYMKSIICTTFFIGSWFAALAQWNVSTIPESLIKNTEWVVRRNVVDIKIYDTDRIDVAENMVVTFLDKDAFNHFILCGILTYSDIQKSIRLKVYDFNGKRVKNAQVDVTSVDQLQGRCFKLVNESNSKINFPLTVELEYKGRSGINGDLRTWGPVTAYNVSLQNATLRITVADTSLISYQNLGIPLIEKHINEDGNFVLLWELTNYLPKIKGSSLELPDEKFPMLKFEVKH